MAIDYKDLHGIRAMSSTFLNLPMGLMIEPQHVFMDFIKRNSYSHIPLTSEELSGCYLTQTKQTLL